MSTTSEPRIATNMAIRMSVSMAAPPGNGRGRGCAQGLTARPARLLWTGTLHLFQPPAAAAPATNQKPAEPAPPPVKSKGVTP